MNVFQAFLTLAKFLMNFFQVCRLDITTLMVLHLLYQAFPVLVDDQTFVVSNFLNLPLCFSVLVWSEVLQQKCYPEV